MRRRPVRGLRSLLDAPKRHDVALEVSALLDRRGVPHAFVGWIARWAHGWECFGGELEILVPSDRDDVVQHAIRRKPEPLAIRGLVGYGYWMRGVIVHVMRPEAVPSCLDEAIARAERNAALRLRVLPIEALVLLNLRTRDLQRQVDIIQLWKAGAIPVRKVRRYLEEHAPENVEGFELVMREARRDKRRCRSG